MAKKIVTKPIDVMSVKNEDFTWESFIPNILKGKYVLVLGSDIMLSKEKNVECDGDSNRLIFNCVKENLIESERIGRNNKARNFTELSRDRPEVKKGIVRMIGEGMDFSIDEMSDELVNLIRSKVFRVVLTTTFDPYIEILMSEVWGDELQVMDINANPSSQNYDIKDCWLNDIPDYTRPVLYYVFGKAFPAESASSFAATDNDAIEIMSKWMGSSAPYNILQYVRSKRLLALGCKFEDWFFRFFWYTLRGDIKNIHQGEVAISLTDSVYDSKLKDFLFYSKIHFEPDSRHFVRQLLDRLSDYEQNESQIISRDRQMGGVFLSYAHEDFNIVRTVYYGLLDLGIPVWFDDRYLSGGDRYDEKINAAISECRVFVPIMSGQVQTDISEGTPRYYKDTEWKLAQTYINGGKKIEIVPIRITGYDFRNAQNLQYLPDAFKERTMHDLETRPLSEFLTMMNDILKKSN